MITVKNAVARATAYLMDVFSDAKDVQLEEVELSEDDMVWNVTLSFLRLAPQESFSPFQAAAAAASLLTPKYERVYKLVAVDAKSGACQSIKIRQLQ